MNSEKERSELLQKINKKKTEQKMNNLVCDNMSVCIDALKLHDEIDVNVFAYRTSDGAKHINIDIGIFCDGRRSAEKLCLLPNRTVLLPIRLAMTGTELQAAVKALVEKCLQTLFGSGFSAVVQFTDSCDRNMNFSFSGAADLFSKTTTNMNHNNNKKNNNLLSIRQVQFCRYDSFFGEKKVLVSTLFIELSLRIASLLVTCKTSTLTLI